MASVDFFFGTGSRYSYLASTRISSIAAQTGATIRWRAIYSPEVIRRAGADPFAVNALRGQYHPAYRTRDAIRWAQLYGVPYIEPDFAATDWWQIALWAVAADLAGHGAAFGAAVLNAAFAHGAPPQLEAALTALSANAGVSASLIIELVNTGGAQAAHEQNVRDVLSAGGFGVPTFVVDDGQVFWGQDRIPLLVHHLLTG